MYSSRGEGGGVSGVAQMSESVIRKRGRELSKRAIYFLIHQQTANTLVRKL